MHLGPETEALLKTEGVLTVADFAAMWPGMPKSSVYSRIRAMVQSGRLSQVGRGIYQAVHKPRFSVPVSDWMLEVNHYLVDVCEGMNFCLVQIGANLFIETAKSNLTIVMGQLKNKYSKVVLQKEAKRFPAELEGYIIVGHMVSDAPLIKEDNLSVPSLEKLLVDELCNKQEDPMAFQKAMEIYPVNLNRLRRYASRRGATEELSARLSLLNQDRINMFGATQKYLATIPVQRAWVFGSFARGEETQESDLDLLVDYDKNARLSLLDVVRYKIDLEKILGREVDLIQNGCLKPFAVPSAERDKYLIYER